MTLKITRNQWHKIVGFFAAILVYLFAYQAYQIVGKVLFSMFITMVGAVAWEWLRKIIYNYTPDYDDVKRAFYPAVAANVICVIVDLILR